MQTAEQGLQALRPAPSAINTHHGAATDATTARD